MSICIPFKPSDTGGTSIFMRKFMKGLVKKGIEVTTDIDDDYELLFVIITYDGFFNKKLQEKKREGVKVVQRLDGVLTFATSNFLYPLHNFGMKYVHNKLADYIIFQSRYSKFLCDKFLGMPRCDWSIIYNGVDTDKFSPMGEGYKYEAETSLFTVSGFRRSQQIIPMVKAVDIISKKIENFEFVIVGPVKPKLMSLIPKSSKYVRYIGKIKNEDLPFYERSADVFMFSTLNPPCPNAVLEAISCGLPIAGYNTGAMPELVGNEAGLLAEHKSNDLYRFSKANPEKLAEVTLKILEENKKYKKQARKRAVRLFSLDKMVNDYIDVFEKVLGA